MLAVDHQATDIAVLPAGATALLVHIAQQAGQSARTVTIAPRDDGTLLLVRDMGDCQLQYRLSVRVDKNWVVIENAELFQSQLPNFNAAGMVLQDHISIGAGHELVKTLEDRVAFKLSLKHFNL